MDDMGVSMNCFINTDLQSILEQDINGNMKDLREKFLDNRRGIEFCEECGKWNLRKEDEPCSNCQASTQSQSGSSLQSTSVSSEGGKPMKIFKSQDIPFNLKTINRSPLEILGKKRSMTKERKGSFGDDNYTEGQHGQDMDNIWTKIQGDSHSSMQRNIDWLGLPSYFAKFPPPHPPPPPSSSRSGSEFRNLISPASSSQSSLTSSLQEQGKKEAEKLNEELLNRLDILDQMQKLKNELEPKTQRGSGESANIKEKMTATCKLKVLKYKLGDEVVKSTPKDGDYRPEGSKSSNINNMNNNSVKNSNTYDVIDALMKEQLHSQQELAELRQELESLKMKSNVTKAEEDNILFKLLPSLSGVDAREVLDQDLLDYDLVTSYRNKYNAEYGTRRPRFVRGGVRTSIRGLGVTWNDPIVDSLPVSPPSSGGRLLRSGEVGLVPRSGSDSRTSQGPVFSKVFKMTSKPATTEVILEDEDMEEEEMLMSMPHISQGPCMKFTNLFDLSGQLDEFCHGQNGSKFVIERLETGTDPERQYAFIELKLPRNLLKLINNANCLSVVETLLQVDQSSRRSILQHIKTHPQLYVQVDKFWDFFKMMFISNENKYKNPQLKSDLKELIAVFNKTRTPTTTNEEPGDEEEGEAILDKDQELEKKLVTFVESLLKEDKEEN